MAYVPLFCVEKVEGRRHFRACCKHLGIEGTQESLLDWFLSFQTIFNIQTIQTINKKNITLLSDHLTFLKLHEN